MTDNTRRPATRPNWPGHAGGALVSALQMSAVYRARDPDALDDIYEGRTDGYTYAREGHPNADVLAGLIDDLEGVPGGLITSSGMAAVALSLLAVVKAGDHVVAGNQLYGRTLRFLGEELARLGVWVDLVDVGDAANVAAALRPQTRAVLVEVVSNPVLRIADMVGIAALTRQKNIPLIVDNTFTTPAGYSPWDNGADIVVHSVTKLLAGHSDVTLGYVAAKDGDIGDRLRVLSTTWGTTPSPFDCWLAERGVLSFALRHRQVSETAAALAQALADCPGVDQVIYPGFSGHPDSPRSALLRSPGNVVSFRIPGGRAAAVRLTRAAEPLAFAPTLGDIGTTLSHPASSSHRGLSQEGRAALGIDEGFFRVSVGIEPAEDIISHLLRGVAAARG